MKVVLLIVEAVQSSCVTNVRLTLQTLKEITLIKANLWMFVLLIGLSANANAAGLASAKVSQSNSESTITVEGVVEAVKASQIAAQVTGSITVMSVKAGDHVKAGQLLTRIDARMANQQAISNQAQTSAAQAQLDAASKEYERKRHLFEKQYISQAALERAESDYKTAAAQSKAQLAQAGISNVQSGLHSINAPYAGVVAEVLVDVGDMALPGQVLIKMYDAHALRVVVNVPQSQVAQLKKQANIKVMIGAASLPETTLTTTQFTVLPTADPMSNMVKLRLILPPNLSTITPGMFARAMLPVNAIEGKSQLYIPSKAVIKRSELLAVYVIDAQGHPQLRQVRLGRVQGDNVEVFAGLQLGELVALDPMAAANFK